MGAINGHYGLLMAAATGGGDPYFANVSALLHFDAADGSTTFTDQTGKTWTRAGGTTQIDTAQSKFGGSSCLFDGVSTSYVSTADDAGFDFGAGDFTIEAWVRPAALTTASQFPAIFGQQASDAANVAYLLYLNQNNSGAVFHYTSNGSTRSFATNSIPLVLGQFHHIAVARSGTSLWVYTDGVAGGTNAIGSTTIYDSPQQPAIGAHGTGQTGNEWNGWIDEFRVTKGVCRYPGGTTFTPPTAAFPNS